jgi:CheY-like chemotaxis protein
VLVVEDEAAVRRSAMRALEGMGCTVIAAASGAEGLASIQKADRPIDLIFTDVVMPGLSGPEFVAQARRLLPQVKVLFTTGYTSDMALRLKLLEDGVAVLSKPYTPQDLHQKILSVLSR